MVAHNSAMPTADAMCNRRSGRRRWRCALLVLVLHVKRPKYHREYRRPDKRNRDQRSDTTTLPSPAHVFDL
jgi:hypothetical protein